MIKVDDVDFEISVLDGGLNDIVSFPNLKDVTKTDWAEHDGIEVDLSDPKLDSKKLKVKFLGDVSKLLESISNGAYHTFEFSIGRWMLRLVSCSELNDNIFSLEFADDFPLNDYSYLAPSSNMISQRGYELDGIDLSNYGVAVLDGSDDEILKLPAVKPNLTVNVKNKSGVIYDSKIVKFKEKDVKLKCLMLAKDLTEFWTNYNALLYNLSKPELRSFYFQGYDYDCYYKSQSVSEFSTIGKIWCKFELSIVFTKLGVLR